MIYLLDTDYVSLIQRGAKEANFIRTRLKLVPPDDYGTTIVSYKEQTEGWLAEISRAKKSEATVKAFAQLDSNLRFYGSISVWQYTEAAADRFEFLLRGKVRVGTQDLMIASIALAAGATLLTRDTRDFERVPGLLFEDWTAA